MDTSKAYDRVEWIFLLKILLALGFNSKFIFLIFKSISTVSYSFLLIGLGFGHLKPSWGIRQGDPLSAYLFILCAEAFYILSQKLVFVESWEALLLRLVLHPFLICFLPDDTLLFGKLQGRRLQILCRLSIFMKVHQASRLMWRSQWWYLARILQKLINWQLNVLFECSIGRASCR